MEVEQIEIFMIRSPQIRCEKNCFNLHSVDFYFKSLKIVETSDTKNFTNQQKNREFDWSQTKKMKKKSFFLVDCLEKFDLSRAKIN